LSSRERRAGTRMNCDRQLLQPHFPSLSQLRVRVLDREKKNHINLAICIKFLKYLLPLPSNSTSGKLVIKKKDFCPKC
jgi:hypothetical protein